MVDISIEPPEPENDHLRVAFEFLQKETPELCEKICQKQGINTPYNIVFKNLYDTEHADKDIILTPGNPPTLIIADLFVLQCITERKKKFYYRDRLERALERIHRVHRTLNNLVPLSLAHGLKRDAKEWARTTVPGLVEKIAEKYLEFSYAVTVKDTITSTEVTLHGEDLNEIKDKAVRRLSKMIFEREDFDEFYETLKELKLSQSSAKPMEITIGGGDDETRVGINYGSSRINEKTEPAT